MAVAVATALLAAIPAAVIATTATTAEASTLSPILVDETMPFTADAAVWDWSRNVLYALVDGSSSTHANELVALDPATHAVVRSVALGNVAPVAMDATDDLSAMFVATLTPPSVMRVDLATFLVTQTIPLLLQGTVPSYVNDIDVMPGTADTFAVAMHAYVQAVAVYDGATQRALVTAANFNPTSIEFLNQAKLFGTSSSTTASAFYEMNVASDAVTIVDSTPNVIKSDYPDFAFDALGAGWANSGANFDALTGVVQKQLANSGGLVLDERTNRVYQASTLNFSQYNKTTGALVSQRPWTKPIAGSMMRLATFGAGFAVVNFGDLIILMPPQCAGVDATIVGTSTTIDGTSGNDVIYGTPGNDVINGGTGDDIICGGGGKDVIKAGDGNDHVVGSSAAEWIEGGPGNDTLEGNAGIDYLFGDDGTDTLKGGAGQDRLLGGPGADDVDGGDGTDIYSVGSDNTSHRITLDGVADDGTVTGDTSEGDNVRSTVEVVTGSPGNDVMTAGDHYVWFVGVGGNDTLTGSAFADRLDGGAGNDALNGLAADDMLVGGDGSDTCVGGTGTNSLFQCEL
jgi:Ca2+-binding RTX toxin-like protein